MMPFLIEKNLTFAKFLTFINFLIIAI